MKGVRYRGHYPRLGLLNLFLLLVWPLGRESFADFPHRQVKVIVHVPPGGGTDTMARLVLKYAGERLGTSFIVENRAGAGGQIGYTVLSRAEPDGATIGTITTTTIVTHELTRKQVPYRWRKSFIPIAQITLAPSGVFVAADSPLHSYDELVRHARDTTISCAGTALWGTHHVHAMKLEQATGIKLNYIPMDGASEVLNRLQGGHVELAIGGVSEFRPLIEAGKVRPLVVAAKSRIDWLAEVPTEKELGLDLTIGSRRGFAVPANTPQEIIDQLARALEQAVQDPEFLKDASRVGIAPILDYQDSESFRGALSRLSRTMESLVKSHDVAETADPFVIGYPLSIVVLLVVLLVGLLVGTARDRLRSSEGGEADK